MNISINSNVGTININALPDKCPFCHKSVRPNPLYGYKSGVGLEVFMSCPDSSCLKSFIGYYIVPPGSSVGQYQNSTIQGRIVGKSFSEKISEISPAFVTIYNQAYNAEQLNLTEICGVGYRKALEFLIKEYCILVKPAEKTSIEKKFLGIVIENYVDDYRIKAVAKRATWLGNDETHYIKKWEGKDLQDLKKLIELTVHWIEMESLTASFENEMPEN